MLVYQVGESASHPGFFECQIQLPDEEDAIVAFARSERRAIAFALQKLSDWMKLKPVE